MDKQIIISIGREYGAGGLVVAKLLAEKYALPLYDKNILEISAKENGIDMTELQEYEEKKKNLLFSRTVSGYSNAPQDIVAQTEFDFLKKKAAQGESFIVVGRCGNSILKEYPCLVRIFITSDMDSKKERIMGLYPDLNENAAEKQIIIQNKKRKSFHNHYCKEKWGDSRYYDLTVNVAKTGYRAASEIIDKYINSIQK